LITFAQLNELYLMDVHIDYVEQFLFETNTRLPRLNYLTINYEPLAIVTNNFMNDAARFNCSQLRYIYICEPFVLEYCNPRVGYPYPNLGTGMKLTGTGRVRVGKIRVRVGYG
jgi:hypothetical protein